MCSLFKVHTVLDRPFPISQFEKYFTPNEVKGVIQTYTLKKSPGFYSIAAGVSKYLPKML